MIVEFEKILKLKSDSPWTGTRLREVRVWIFHGPMWTGVRQYPRRLTLKDEDPPRWTSSLFRLPGLKCFGVLFMIRLCSRPLCESLCSHELVRVPDDHALGFGYLSESSSLRSGVSVPWSNGRFRLPLRACGTALGKLSGLTCSCGFWKTSLVMMFLFEKRGL